MLQRGEEVSENIEESYWQEEEAIFGKLEKELLMQVDMTQDISTEINTLIEYVPDTYMTEIMENLSLYLAFESMEYGYFTNGDSQEALLIFSVCNTCHAEGFDRKLMVIYSVETGELVFQKCFAGDEVEIEIQDNISYNYSCIFMTTYWMSNGVARSTGEFGYIIDGSWVSISVPNMDDGKSYWYKFEDENLFLTEWLDGTEESEGYQTYGETTEYYFSWDDKEFIVVE